MQIPTGVNFLQNSHLDWNQQQQSQVDEKAYQCIRDKRQPVSHGKMLGGCSSINLMLYMQGHPHDFDTWADITQDPSWKYANLLKYFKKSENLQDPKVLNSEFGRFHGTEGPMKVTKLYSDTATKYLNIYEEMGFKRVMDINGNGSVGGFTEQMVTEADGLRQSTANAHLRAANGRSNLYVLRNSMVTKVLIDDNNVARGVEYVDTNNKTYTVTAKKEVIVSCGPINSAHLLLKSGIGPKEQLEKFGIKVVSDLPVGQKVRTHYGPFLVYVTDKVDPNVKAPPVDPFAFPVPIMTGLVALDESQQYPDYMAATVAMNSELLALTFCSVIFGFDRNTCQILYDYTYGREVLFAAITGFSNENKGRISLKSADPLDTPDIYLDAYATKENYETTLDYMEHFSSRIVNTTHFKNVGGELVDLPQCMDYDKNTREYLDCYAQCMSSTYYHYTGTCAMGEVVDSEMRVYGVKGLRVIDSGVFPTMTSGTTNAPTIMVGEKGADLVKMANQ